MRWASEGSRAALVAHRSTVAAHPMTTQPAPDFDAAREAYETAQGKLLGLIDAPDKTVPVNEYRAMLKQAAQEKQKAHETMMEAWG